MSELDRILRNAIETNADPRIVSPSGTSFAWIPVFGWDHITKSHRKIWMERVIWFRPLGLFTEYSTYAGSEQEFHDKHGRYSWEAADGKT